MPAISVIVPVYKAEAFLRGCADSILKQTFSDLELILVEDGSPDQSGALCDAIAAEDGRVRVFHKPNGGVSSARNLGIQEAQGDFVAFCDADDSFAPNALELLYTAVQAEEADSAGCGHYNLWPDGRKEAEAGALPAGVYGPAALREGIVLPLLGQRLDFGRGVLNGFIWRFLFRRSILQAHSITFAGAYLEDELFLLEYFLYAQKLVMVDQPLYFYLQNPASVTKNYLPDYIGVFRAFMERKRALARTWHLDEALPDWEDNSNWAGLLIAVSNEYAPGNRKTSRQKAQFLRELCAQPDMARAIAQLHPKGLAGNKQLVADLIRGGHFTLLTLLYNLKNRRK
mgnify:CR=1 FL=1